MNLSKQNIYLVGAMGSGKTTIGRLIAKELGLDFQDCDQKLEQITGASVNLIFDVEGEQGFRLRETQLLKSMSKLEGVVIATGGGVVSRLENRKILCSNGLVIWLKTTVQQQINRLSQDKSRPLLQTPDREETLQRLAEIRNPLYREVSDLQFTSPNKNTKYSAHTLCKLIRNHQDSGSGGEIRAQN